MKRGLHISKLLQDYPASGIRKMFNIASQYDDLVNLTLGEPNFDTPEYIREAAKKALDEGQTHYTVNTGMPVLREAIAERYRKTHWDGYAKDNVIITVGALEGLTIALLALVDPGDEVIVPDPCYPNYFGQIKLVGARPFRCRCTRKTTTESRRRTSKKPSPLRPAALSSTPPATP